jgi:peptidoglycan/LPS O-acetylase OafA/YrhL
MKLTYRPEIDGLRAIAVGAVILYHAQITILGHQPFKGGFIGVDIFFVISGYLITSIILKELVTTGSFSFKHFYERRIRRILPALLFVMFVLLPFAWMYLLPSSFVDFSKSILYSLGFSSNFYFWYSGLIYGVESGLLKPFLHTWSLSVEEQYYILFPIVLLITFRYFRKYLIHILILGFIISLGLADWGSGNYPVFNFYILPTRGWELLAGSILAYFEITNSKRSENKTLNLILPTLGLLLIGHSILFFNVEMFHPSFYTLSPIIGVCLIIWFSNKDEIITKILSTKLFVGIGLMSYSLYLWHYPIFAFARISEFTQGSLFKKFLLGIIIALVSIFSYYFVERPFRNRHYKFKIIFSIIIIFISFLLVFNIYVIKKKGLKNRMPSIILNSLSESKSNLNCGGGKTCRFNDFSNKIVYLIGDSHMGRLLPDLKNKVVKKNYQFKSNIFGGCMYFRGFNFVNLKNSKVTECNDRYYEKIENQISQDENSVLVFGGYFPSYFLDRVDSFIPVGKYNTLLKSFKSEILKFSKKNKIILVYPIPEVEKNPNQVILNQWVKQGFSKDFNIQNFTASYRIFKDRTKSSFELLDSIQGENIYRVYPHSLFCDTIIKDKCVTHDDRNIFYTDYTHPSPKGAEMINDLIIKEIEKIELKSN